MINNQISNKRWPAYKQIKNIFDPGPWLELLPWAARLGGGSQCYFIWYLFVCCRSIHFYYRISVACRILTQILKAVGHFCVWRNEFAFLMLWLIFMFLFRLGMAFTSFGGIFSPPTPLRLRSCYGLFVFDGNISVPQTTPTNPFPLSLFPFPSHFPAPFPFPVTNFVYRLSLLFPLFIFPFPCLLIPEYLNTWIPEYLNTWISEYLNIWLPEYLKTWIPEYLNTWIPECLNTWIPECLNTWIPEYLTTWIPEY